MLQRLFKYQISPLLKTGGKLMVSRNAELFLHPNAETDLGGELSFGESWTPKDPFPSVLALRENARLIVRHRFQIYSGSRVYINKNATLKLGSGYINNNLNLSCHSVIEIGEDVAISENVTIRDSDNHQIKGSSGQMILPISIGNRVWVGLNVTILKGVTIGDGSVIAAGSVVTRSIPPNCLAAGVPARVIKKTSIGNDGTSSFRHINCQL